MKATEVQGASKEVGAKVMYQGREMTVSKGVDSDDDLKMSDPSGITACADALKANAALTSLKCVAPRLSPKCQQPLTLSCCPVAAASDGTTSEPRARRASPRRSRSTAR